MANLHETFETLQKVLENKFEVAKELIRPESTLVELGLDSLTLMEFIFEAEDTFHLRIPEDNLNSDLSKVSLKEVCLSIIKIQSN